jgi:nitrite reductase/ring-hydroxylating ferredoxin subunit
VTLVKVAETSEIPLGQMRAVKIDEKEVLIANVNGVYYAHRKHLYTHGRQPFKRNAGGKYCDLPQA